MISGRVRWSRELSFPASLLRLVFGLLGAFAVPLIVPALQAHRWVFVAYVLAAAVVQLLIYKEIGRPEVRGLACGVVDLAVVTFLAHRLGTVTTVIPFLYLVIAALNALVVGARVSFILVSIGCAMYLGVLTAELVGFLPYAPDGGTLLPGRAPALGAGLAAGGVFVLALILTTTSMARMQVMIGRLRQRVRVAEQMRQLLQKLAVGRYRLERPLGRGGMGQVWEGVHTVTGARFALKFLGTDTISEEDRRRFIREAKAAAAVDHPNVVKVYDVFEEAGIPVMVMDVLRGKTLRERLDQAGPLTVEETASVMRPVVSAVGTAHARGIVHRDLKPENIFLARNDDGAETVKVLDFGIAKITDLEAGAATGAALTMTGTLLGTPYYMAPEQAFGDRKVDQRADMWALGVILYECLAGTRPIDGDNLGQIFRQLAAGKVRPIAEVASDLPHDIASCVMGLLEPNPARRPKDLRVVFDVLATYTSVRAPTFGPAQSEAVSPHTVVEAERNVDSAAATIEAVSSDGNTQASENATPPVPAGRVDASPPSSPERR